VLWAFVLFGLAAGAMLPFQAGINARLAEYLGSPLRAALASLVVDHFGMVGFGEHPATLGRVLGVILIACGVLLVRLF